MEAEYKAGKEVQIQLAKAVALENNRGSITAAQKAGRATKTTGLGSRSESRSETELVNALAVATNAVSTAANVLEISPPIRRPVQNSSPPLRLRRQLFTQSQSSPIRQLQSRVLPHLPASEPVKKTRKRRALVEDHGEVDMGPRKLRSRR
jgi:hypothetical protein